MKFKYQNRILTIGKGKIEFENSIKEVVECDNILVVIIDYQSSKINENVFGINSNCKIEWQIPKMEKIIYQDKEYIGITKPYSNLIKINQDKIRLINRDSTYFDVDPKNGKLLTNPIASRLGNRPW